MKRRIAPLLVIAAALVGGPQALGSAEDATFQCPPCNCNHDGHAFEKAGTCPSCGMKLVENITTVGIVLFEGVQIIDFSGPYEVFGQAHFNVFTVSHDGAPLKTTMNLTVDPTYAIDDSPVPDILVVPGGGVDHALKKPKLMAWLQRTAAKSRHILSVCNGAFILANAGLLNGKSATTFHRLLAELERTATQTKVVWDQRFVDNGRIVTSAGLSSGIDAALHVVSKIKGLPAARRTALHLEYEWDPKSTYARGAFADMHLPPLKPPTGVKGELVETGGDRDRWTVVFRIDMQDKLRLQRHADAQLKKAGWSHRGAGRWTFDDRNGQPWSARTRLDAAQDGIRFRIEIKRAS